MRGKNGVFCHVCGKLVDSRRGETVEMGTGWEWRCYCCEPKRVKVNLCRPRG